MALTGSLQINTALTPEKFYSLGQTVIAGGVPSTGPVTINFQNGAFAAKIMAILTDSDNKNRVSTLLFNCCGGNNDSPVSAPSWNVALANVCEFHNTSDTLPWSPLITTTPTSVTFNAKSTAAAGYLFSVSIDFLAHNPAYAGVSSIDVNGSTVITYDF